MAKSKKSKRGHGRPRATPAIQVPQQSLASNLTQGAGINTSDTTTPSLQPMATIAPTFKPSDVKNFEKMTVSQSIAASVGAGLGDGLFRTMDEMADNFGPLPICLSDDQLRRVSSQTGIPEDFLVRIMEVLEEHGDRPDQEKVLVDLTKKFSDITDEKFSEVDTQVQQAMMAHLASLVESADPEEITKRLEAAKAAGGDFNAFYTAGVEVGQVLAKAGMPVTNVYSLEHRLKELSVERDKAYAEKLEAATRLERATDGYLDPHDSSMSAFINNPGVVITTTITKSTAIPIFEPKHRSPYLHDCCLPPQKDPPEDTPKVIDLMPPEIQIPFPDPSNAPLTNPLELYENLVKEVDWRSKARKAKLEAYYRETLLQLSALGIGWVTDPLKVDREAKAYDWMENLNAREAEDPWCHTATPAPQEPPFFVITLKSDARFVRHLPKSMPSDRPETAIERGSRLRSHKKQLRIQKALRLYHEIMAIWANPYQFMSTADPLARQKLDHCIQRATVLRPLLKNHYTECAALHDINPIWPDPHTTAFSHACSVDNVAEYAVRRWVHFDEAHWPLSTDVEEKLDMWEDLKAYHNTPNKVAKGDGIRVFNPDPEDVAKAWMGDTQRVADEVLDGFLIDTEKGMHAVRFCEKLMKFRERSREEVRGKRDLQAVLEGYFWGIVEEGEEGTGLRPGRVWTKQDGKDVKPRKSGINIKGSMGMGYW